MDAANSNNKALWKVLPKPKRTRPSLGYESYPVAERVDGLAVYACDEPGVKDRYHFRMPGEIGVHVHGLPSLEAVIAMADEQRPLRQAKSDGLPVSPVAEWAGYAILLVEADEPARIRMLEKLAGCTQEEAVTHFIEQSCWADDMAEFSRGKGTAEQRRFSLRTAWREDLAINDDRIRGAS
jgi:hypothetical protein